MKNITAALILAVGLVVYGFVSRQPVSQVTTLKEPEYRYQFFNDEIYFKEKVFDRRTGVVYYLGKNEDRKCYAIDFKNGRSYWKDEEQLEWNPDEMVFMPETMPGTLLEVKKGMDLQKIGWAKLLNESVIQICKPE